MLALAACTANSDSATIGKLLVQEITGAPAQKIGRDAAAAIPFATMGLQLGSGPEALLVLGTATPEHLDWYAGDQVVIMTQKGRIIRTVGLPYDLGGEQIATAASEGPAQTTLRLDFPDLGVYGALAACTKTDRGRETIQILGADVSVRHEVERCAAEALNWKFENDFWSDPQTGYVWRSSQYIHPKSPPLILEVLRPEQSGPE